ncbi:MAG: hypothetical protein AB7K63_14980 [Vicinamibacterales bacterium]
MVDHPETAPRARRSWFAVGTLLVLSLSISASAQDAGTGAGRIPADATALEGLPAVRVETTSEKTTRRQLEGAEAAGHRLRVRIDKDGFYWSSRDNRRLAVTAAGAFTYLSSSEPGTYVRIQRLNDRFTYVEHVDTDLGSVTYWGELRIVLGK